MKKVSIASLNKEIAELRDRKYDLERNNRFLDNQVYELKKEISNKEELENQKEYFRGQVDGMNILLDRFQFDMSVKNKNLDNDKIKAMFQPGERGW